MAGKRKSGQGASPKPKVIKAGAAEFAHVRQITDWFLGMMVNGTGFLNLISYARFLVFKAARHCDSCRWARQVLGNQVQDQGRGVCVYKTMSIDHCDDARFIMIPAVAITVVHLRGGKTRLRQLVGYSIPTKSQARSRQVAYSCF